MRLSWVQASTALRATYDCDTVGYRLSVGCAHAPEYRRGAAAGLLASLKSLPLKRRGWSCEKGDPFARRTSIAAPYHPWHPCCPIYPRIPIRTTVKVPGNGGQPLCRSNRPSRPEGAPILKIAELERGTDRQRKLSRPKVIEDENVGEQRLQRQAEGRTFPVSTVGSGSLFIKPTSIRWSPLPLNARASIHYASGHARHTRLTRRRRYIGSQRSVAIPLAYGNGRSRTWSARCRRQPSGASYGPGR